MTLPLAGHPVGAPSLQASVSAEDRIESAGRFLVADLLPFGKNARIQLAHAVSTIRWSATGRSLPGAGALARGERAWSELRYWGYSCVF